MLMPVSPKEGRCGFGLPEIVSIHSADGDGGRQQDECDHLKPAKIVSGEARGFGAEV